MTVNRAWPSLIGVTSDRRDATPAGEAARCPARRIAVSGHRGLPGPTAALVGKAILEALAGLEAGVTGISALAGGPHLIFAATTADLVAGVEVIVRGGQYRDVLPADERPEYDRLLAKA